MPPLPRSIRSLGVKTVSILYSSDRGDETTLETEAHIQPGIGLFAVETPIYEGDIVEIPDPRGGTTRRIVAEVEIYDVGSVEMQHTEVTWAPRSASTVPIGVRPDVNRSTLDRLIDLGAESATLDFKQSFNLDDRRELVEVAKDVGAMMPRGGHIVIGADSSGQVIAGAGISPNHRQHFDEANLRGKLARYLGTNFEMHTAVHEVEGVLIGVIHVQPHRQGFLAFKADGTYQDPRDQTRTQTAFREGDIYVRRGTASVRANQEEINRIIQETANRLSSPANRLVEIEEARYAREEEARFAELEQRRMADEASRTAEWSVRFAFRDSAETRGRVIARNEGPAPASAVSLEVWAARGGNRVEIEPLRGGDQGPTALVEQGGSVHLDFAFDLATPNPEDWFYLLRWTDGVDVKEKTGRVATN